MSAFAALPERLDLTTLPAALDPLLVALRRQAQGREPAPGIEPAPATGMPGGELLRIRGSTLRHFDSAAVAALVALIREGSNLGVRVQLEHLPEGLISLASVYGLHAEFGAPRA